jgi:hypothetical protein
MRSRLALIFFFTVVPKTLSPDLSMLAIALVILRRAQALRGTIRLRESDMRLTGSPFTAYFVMSPFGVIVAFSG